jgi:tetratricopeptide (TPR) repeat protein
MRPPAALFLVPLVLTAAACRKETSAAANPPAEESGKTEAGTSATATGNAEAPPSSGSSANVSDELFAAAKDADREKLRRLWSTQALVEELERRGCLGKPDAAAMTRVKAALDDHFDLLASYLEKRIGETRKVHLTSEPSPGLHYELIRTRQNDGSRDTVMRFWYRESEGGKQLIDCEDITLGYRASTLVLGLVTPQEQPWLKPLLGLMEKLKEAGNDSPFEISTTVADEVDALLAANPPDDLKAFAYKLKAERLTMQRKPADALKAIKEFASFEPKSPWADFLRGLAYMNQHRGFESITAFNRYGETAGWDATAHEYIAWCHYSEGDEKSALAHAKQGLELNKDAIGCLVTAVCASKPAEVAGLAGYFKNSFDAENTYEYVMEQIVDMDDPAIPKAVLALLEKELPNSKLIATYKKKLETSTE